MHKRTCRLGARPKRIRAYQIEMKHRLEKTPNLEIKQGTIEDLIVHDDRITGLITKEGIMIAKLLVFLRVRSCVVYCILGKPTIQVAVQATNPL